MTRKNFVELLTACSGVFAFHSFHNLIANSGELRADVVIVGGGLGGCAAALAALRNNLTVILTEETLWIGGQLTQQGVPPDEHQWIETHGCTKLYRDFRNLIRKYYKLNYALTTDSRNEKYFNPGNGSVSNLCHEPKVALAVLMDLFSPYLISKKLTLLTGYKIKSADYTGDRITALKVSSYIQNRSIILNSPFFIDATELGDLLPVTGAEYTNGSEARIQTGELHAPEIANEGNIQAFTACFAIDYLHGEDHTIEKPAAWDYWRNFKPELKPPWPGKLLDLHYTNPSTLAVRELGFNPEGFDTSPLFNLWTYRRIINKMNFKPGTFRSDITVVNWPQNDYLNGNLIGATPGEFQKHVDSAKQLSLSLLYWLQTEAPGLNDKQGWQGLRLRKDIFGTDDGFAMHPYIRESRRIKAVFTVLEEHVGKENRTLVTGKANGRAAEFYDSVGTGYYHIDLHPTCKGDNYIDFDSLKFQIPLGSLLPQRIENLVASNKNIGTTHITNGCYRLHPVEWSIGEAAGLIVAFSLRKKVIPAHVWREKKLLSEFQEMIRNQGIETAWPENLI